MPENIEFRSLCPVATSLDVMGDKWTLLILRDMIWMHKSMFHEFKEAPEKMPSKMLSNRLKKLESMGFISKQKGTINKKSIYYLMQERGFDTFPMMIEMAIFTTKHFFDHLGNTYTKDVKARMLKDKQVYTKELITNYKNFSKKLVI
jgi:DNA-binding HxlR family transcriptional regulator